MIDYKIFLVYLIYLLDPKILIIFLNRELKKYILFLFFEIKLLKQKQKEKTEYNPKEKSTTKQKRPVNKRPNPVKAGVCSRIILER